MSKLDLSIIIASFNTKKLTLDCIKSIFNHKIDYSYEVVVVDDNSTDGSIDALQKLKGIKLLLNKENLGYVRTNNKGMDVAKGEYILLLNSDTILKDNSVNNLLKFAKSTSDSGVVGGQLLNTNNTIQESCYHEPSILNTINGITRKYYPDTKDPTIVDAVIGAVFLITPKAKKEVGFLDEKYISYYEDLDYCRRVRKSGLKVYYLPSSKTYHYGGASFKQLTDWKNQWRKLIPSSKLYNGIVKHYILFSIMWIQQKWQKYFG